MDFAFSQQEASFRKEVRQFIQKEFPAELRWYFRPTFAPSIHGLDDAAWEVMKAMSRKLGARGWLSLSWPREYGGQNSAFRQNIVYEELLYHNCPGVEPIGATFLPPTLIRFGSEEQKKGTFPRSLAAGHSTANC